MSPHLSFKRVVQFGAVASLIVFGCEQESQDTNPTSFPLTGDMVGFVTLYDSDGFQRTDHSGVIVAVDGSNTATLSDSSGRYVLPNIATGTYTITYSKTGYGSTRTNLFQFVGGGQAFLGTSVLCKPPTVSVDSVRNPILGSLSSFDVTLTDTSSANCGAILFFGKGSETSSIPSAYLLAVPVRGPFTRGLLTVWIGELFEALKSAGFHSGDSAYVVAYSSTGNRMTSGYTDIATGRRFYTCIDAHRSAPLGFTIR